MFSDKDDTAIIKIALSRKYIHEDEVRECSYIRSQKPEESLISILKAKGYLSDKDYLSLFKMHAQRELWRSLRFRTRMSTVVLSGQMAAALSEAETGFKERVRESKRQRAVDVPDLPSVLICPGCATKYNASRLKEGRQYKCRKCGGTLEVPLLEEIEDLEPDAELEEAFDGEELIGQVLSGCKIVEKIGEGGMGVVYRGKHLTLDRDVAIKVLHKQLTNEFYRNRFLAESRAAAKLTHPNVVQVFDAGQKSGYSYIVMEFVEGATAKQLLHARKRLSLAFVVRIVSEAARGLAAAHKIKLVHRDVKPENIMISFTGDTKVMDFGLAKDVDMQGDITKAGMLMGTPFYMAPEQFMNDAQVDHRADIYALGVTSYHMLIGRPPFLGDSPYKVMNAHLNEKYKPLRELDPDIPPELEAIIDKMLLKEPENRYQSMLQVAKSLQKVNLPSVSSETEE